jgi:hypothetical protein
MQQASFLHSPDGGRHARPSHPKCTAERLVCQRDFIALDPVVGHQKESCEPLVKGVARIAGGELRGLNHPRLDVPEQNLTKPWQHIQGLSEIGGTDPERISRYLHDAAVRRSSRAQDQRKPDEIGASKQADLQGAAPGYAQVQRCRPLLDEVAACEWHVPLVEDLAALNLDALKSGAEFSEHFIGHGAKEAIAAVGHRAGRCRQPRVGKRRRGRQMLSPAESGQHCCLQNVITGRRRHEPTESLVWWDDGLFAGRR